MNGAADVSLTIDDRTVLVPAGTTVFDAARLNRIEIPTLCHQQNETPVGVCRLCVVEVRGARVLAASCVRQAEPGMVVATGSAAVLRARRTLLEMLLADHPSPCARQRASADCELETLAKQAGVEKPRFAKGRTPRGQDTSSAVIAVDHEACILCDRCIRGCNEVRGNLVLGRMGKGHVAGIAFDRNLPMGDSSCISCGECMVSCPTGALTNVGAVGTDMPQGEAVDPEELLRSPLFAGVSGTFLGLNRGAIVRRQFRQGEVICREGEFGSTAFYIVEGRAEVFLASQIGHVKTEGGARGFLSKLHSRLVGREVHQREEEQGRRFIPIDASVDLAYDNPVAELGAGELFGEMTCMNKYPRSATVRAATDCTVLEMLRNVLDILLRNKSFKEQVERRYRERALDSHLRSVPMFSRLPDDFIGYLRDRVELLRFNRGQVICAQGEPADSFYLVRIGFVKVSESRPGGEMVLAYLPRGSYFGEIGLLGGGLRTATCTALDHVEVVRIAAGDFKLMVERFPDIRRAMEEVAGERQLQNRLHAAQTASVPLQDFLDKGLMEAQSLLVLDLERCTRCDACVRACAAAHDGITRLVREGVRFENYLIATSCRQCRDPLCMVGCPVGSIRRRSSLEIIIEDWCIGCGLCAENCPYGNINMHPFSFLEELSEPVGDRRIARVKQKATTCDLCTEHAEPSCVYACPHDAAHRVDPNQFFAGLLR